VIGLAGVSQAEVDEPQPDVESLYRFFAEEIFGALGDEVRSGLLTLALAPVIDHQLPTELLGATAAEVVVRSAVDVGIIVARSSHLEMHPLARSFLTEWSGRTPKPSADKVAMQCLSHYRRLRDWDAAFEVLSRHKWSDELERLAGEALDELLDTARLKTLERWSELASETAPNAHVFSLARAEVALRRGRFTEAQTHGEAAASEPDLAYRALSVAGRAAHLASREEEALEFYEGAESVADDERQRRGARWGQLSCLIDLERAEAASAREALSTSLVRSDPTDVVRCATSGLGYELKCGTLDLAEADRAYELIDSLRDPIARTSFESIYSLALCLVARYDEALVVAGSLLDVAKRYRLDFALPYALSSAATAHAGRREWRLAHRCIEEAVMTAREGKNSYAEHVCVAAQIRILAQQGMHDRALALRLPDAPCPLPAVRAELKVSRALVLASASRLREAVALLDEARDTTRAIEPTVLIKAVDAICALKGRTEPLTPRLREFVDSARNTGGLDLLVTTYRSTPELLPVLLRDAVVGDDVARVVQQVGDEDLAEAVDVPLGLEDRYQLLSRREREVLQCIRDGLSNRQIAETLFISEGTAKAHTHRIFEKLGTSSRVALVVKGLLERKSQATSAIEEADDETDSPLL
jgi:DNA-binding CsgD family transcriptional regulator/tetratricopeptide (TPR) repeat protein